MHGRKDSVTSLGFSHRKSLHHHDYGKFTLAEDVYTEKFFDRALHHAHKPARDKSKSKI
jgi:hypothetical protein